MRRAAPPDVVLTLESPPLTPAPAGAPLAGLHLRANRSVPGLPALRPSPIALSEVPPAAGFVRGAPLPGSPFDALLGEYSTRITCLSAPLGITVRATGFGEVFVSGSGSSVRWRPGDDDARQRPELILGPGLLLALAFRGTFCLHASSVLAPGGAVLFAGESGAGKSTLAARLAARHHLPRLTDDLTPFAATSSGALVLPHYPQLKLPSESQYPASAPPRLPLARLYLLAESDPDGPVLEESVSPARAALEVCRLAVASRLFTAPLTTALLHASAALVENVPVRRLLYPKRPAAIAEVARLVVLP